MRIGRRPERLITAVMADSHGGSSVGLLNPNTVLVRDDPETGEDEEYCPPLNEMQRYLWHGVYHENIASVVDIADGDDIVVLHVGDITHGDKYPEGLMPEILPSEQRTIGRWNMTPWYQHKNVKRVWLLTGTAAHDWMRSSSEAKIANKLRREYPRVDTQVRHLGLLRVGKETVDVSHHGPGGGSREWLRGNVARYYLRDRVYKDRRMGRQPSRVYLRGHFHVSIWEAIRSREQGIRELYELLVIPSFCGVNWHTRQVTRSDPELVNGMWCLVWEDGKLRDIHDLAKTKDLRREESL